MKKILITVSFLLFSALALNAQYNTEVDFGLRLKYSFVRFSDLDPGEIKDQGGKFDSDGIAIGGFLQLRVNHFYFQPELVYSRVTTVMGNQLGLPDHNFGEYDLVFHSVEVPLLLGYRTNFGNVALRFGAGPVFQYLLNTDAETRLTRISDNGIDIFPYPFEESEFNQITVSSRFGVGVDIGPFLFDLKYERSFSRINEELLRTTPFSFGKERTFVIALGYKLFRKKI